jgi:DNA polymerase III delta prime subunit
MRDDEIYICKWHKELEIFYKLKPLLILEGNILDVFTWPGERPQDRMDMPLPLYLYTFLVQKGYRNIVKFDALEGFSAVGYTGEDSLDTFAEICGAKGGRESLNVPFAGSEETGAEYARNAMTQNRVSSAVIMDLASRYLVSPGNLSQALVDAYTNLLKGAQEGRRVRNREAGVSNNNLLILVVNKLNDIPAWFYLDNPFVRTLHVSQPTREEREFMMREEHFREFFVPDIYEEDIREYREKPGELKKLKERFVGMTEGFTKIELRNLMKLCTEERYHIGRMTDIVDLYRYGIRENPWENRRLQETLRTGETALQERVIGQPAAVERTLNVIKRAAAGMSGLQHSSHTKPKGILFFAGPTGTGKTETAKALAQLLFGDESRCVRFDMSEYSQEHSDQKLLGAPPGYVGYEAGGRLTNAVRENPFSILLFDEIEKAHGSILDKFLQILEDGRMTDGQGRTVYFSETVIIFTSNLGIYKRLPGGGTALNVTPGETYASMEKKVRGAVEGYFKSELGRPEILNRIGENIVVFDFIRQEAAGEILDHQLRSIVGKLRNENHIELVIEESVRNVLLEKALGNLENGGRGVGNIVEEFLLNPLSAWMLDEDLLKDAEITVKALDAEAHPVRMEAEGRVR